MKLEKGEVCIRLFLVWLTAGVWFAMVSCQGASSGQSAAKKEVGVVISTDSSGHAVEYVPPSVPAMLNTPEERASFLVANYWGNFDFSDRSLINKPEITEQALSNFINLLPHVAAQQADQAITSMMVSAEVDSAMFAHFVTITEKYLYDPNSPMRNEDLYLPVLRHLLSSSRLDKAHKIRPQALLRMALKNRPGSVATDFVYTLADGRSARLSGIRTEYTILFFNNPDCLDCKRVKELLQRNVNVSKIAILALYPDEELEVWQKTDYPSQWINAYDKGKVLTLRQLYDLKAIPSLYLLDGQKRVVLKDVSVEQLLEHLNRL